jgi:ABC-2 type transport system permease protein
MPMSRWQQVREVARWEFWRFVKLKQQVIGTLVMIVIGLGTGKLVGAVNASESRPVRVAVVGADQLDFALPTVPQVTWDSAARAEAEARAAVANDSLDGALIIQSAESAELVVRRRAGWTEPLEAALVAARRGAAVARVPLPPEFGAAMAAPFALSTEFISPGAGRVPRATRIAAIVILTLGLIVLFSGFSTLFVGITGEKQQRVTEQMVAMVSPQTWMDGKILGLAGAAGVGTGFLVLSGVVLLRAMPLTLGRSPVALPAIASDGPLLALVLLITTLGVLMWFAFLAAIAATIDDPNSSTRTMLLFVPMMPTVLAFMMIPRADSAVAQFMAIFPLTSMGMLPARLVVTSVPWWEPVLAIALLAMTGWGFRIAAGKIFGLGLLMYGKEPSLREMLRWAREA